MKITFLANQIVEEKHSLSSSADALAIDGVEGDGGVAKGDEVLHADAIKVVPFAS